MKDETLLGWYNWYAGTMIMDILIKSLKKEVWEEKE